MDIRIDKRLIREAALRHPAAILEPYDHIAYCDGIDAIIAITEMLGGQTIYVPKAPHIFRNCIAQEIKREYTGNNTARLAEKYGHTERHIRRIIGYT
jgi:Mor family transcriptional regulator